MSCTTRWVGVTQERPATQERPSALHCAGPGRDQFRAPSPLRFLTSALCSRSAPALQTVLPLGVCNPGAAILPRFRCAVGAVPLLGPMYLRCAGLILFD